MAHGGEGEPGGIADAEQLHGKEMSYNNYVDADAARRAAYDFARPCVAITKHSNPCGIAIGTDLADAHRKAHACDPVSAYGGVIAANGVVTEALAAQIAEILTDVLVAPGFDPGALDILTRGRTCASCAARRPTRPPAPSGARSAEACWCSRSTGYPSQVTSRLEARGRSRGRRGRPAGPGLRLAGVPLGQVQRDPARFRRSLGRHRHGPGQPGRLGPAAVRRAGDRARGAVAASDAYFPFADNLEELAQAGVRAVAEPGGSIRDQEVIAAAQQAGISLYFTGVRHFYH